MLGSPNISQSENYSIENFEKTKKMSDIDSSDFPANAKAVAEYSADILNELRDLAARAGLTFLAYLIQVAAEEAKIQTQERQAD